VLVIKPLKIENPTVFFYPIFPTSAGVLLFDGP